MSYESNSVKTAVWLGASLLAYGIYQYRKSNNLEITEDNFWLNQSELLKFSQRLCSGTIPSMGLSQWYNGDHPNSDCNFLTSNEALRRVTAYGEFSFHDEAPTDLNINETYEYEYENMKITIKIIALFDWLKNTYAEIIL